MAADNGRISAAILTTSAVDGGSQVGSLLGQVADRIASLTADNAYD
ncbi:hypothetical protein ACFQX4_00050 [Roseomonas sp. GCM10028921]